jgi:hypothetical protein
MYVGTAGPFKDPGHKDFVIPEPGSADRADPEPVPFKAVNAALDVHQPVCAGKRRIGHGFYQFPFFQPGGTDRAGLGRSGYPGSPGAPPFFRGPAEPKTDRPQGFEKEGVSEPEQRDPGHHKN